MKLKTKNGEIVKGLLACIGVVGIAAVTVTCPNLLKLVPRSYRKKYSAKSINQAIKRLQSKEMIAIQNQDGKWHVRLTHAGLKLLADYEAGDLKISIPRKWDRRWRILIFDIPELHRMKRDRIRQILAQLGFYCLQKSVWIHPYECRDVINLLRVRFSALEEALYLVVQELDGDRWLREHFELRA